MQFLPRMKNSNFEKKLSYKAIIPEKNGGSCKKRSHSPFPWKPSYKAITLHKERSSPTITRGTEVCMNLSYRATTVE